MGQPDGLETWRQWFDTVSTLRQLVEAERWDEAIELANRVLEWQNALPDLGALTGGQALEPALVAALEDVQSVRQGMSLQRDELVSTLQLLRTESKLSKTYGG
ncbi:hypothetical protein [Crenobacter cavernae]|uniref:Flagellar protein FliT n=1 Tax=Crenobacter cavernae TaxID=2290923 RepID=A0ABY0FHU7_9NEIS|nr:hypothetical protein [Crenobacter cavernae]RXZ44822.1 hypothetical protein EBB06_02680 [Crenobacter cavernae]